MVTAVSGFVEQVGLYSMIKEIQNTIIIYQPPDNFIQLKKLSLVEVGDPMFMNCRTIVVCKKIWSAFVVCLHVVVFSMELVSCFNNIMVTTLCK